MENDTLEQIDIDGIWTATQVRKFLQISEATLWRLRSTKDFPAPVKLLGTNKTGRWLKSEVVKWFTNKREK